jgi:hypothetical protein
LGAPYIGGFRPRIRLERKIFTPGAALRSDGIAGVTGPEMKARTISHFDGVARNLVPQQPPHLAEHL